MCIRSAFYRIINSKWSKGFILLFNFWDDYKFIKFLETRAESKQKVQSKDLSLVKTAKYQCLLVLLIEPTLQLQLQNTKVKLASSTENNDTVLTHKLLLMETRYFYQLLSDILIVEVIREF